MAEGDRRSNQTCGVGWETPVFALVGLATAAIGVAKFFSVNSYLAGKSNGDPFASSMKDGVLMLMGMGLCGVLLVLAIVWFATLRRRRSLLSRRIIASSFLMPCVVLGAALFVGIGPRQAYMSGFSAWARTHIDIEAAKTWLASQEIRPSPTLVNANALPAFITHLSPRDVDVMDKRSGLAMTWGETAEFSSRRQVFIDATDHTGAPAVIKWGDTWQECGPTDWQEAAPDIWISLQ
jgi:hypothetical protein